MKRSISLAAIFILFIIPAFAQECDIQVQILEDRYMFGTASKLNVEEPLKKIEVDFTSEYMDVVMPLDGKSYQIRVVNEACQAYCSKAKRVRQLHSGDEKLVKNLFKDKEKEILEQINKCES